MEHKLEIVTLKQKIHQLEHEKQTLERQLRSVKVILAYCSFLIIGLSILLVIFIYALVQNC
jgi:hypothetical protein